MMGPLERDFLREINALIDDRLKPIGGDEMSRSGENLLSLACRHLCVSDHAKRARPLLSLYYHWMFSEQVAIDFTHIGVAAEFIHAASLLHDDIIDEADRRRGKSSANRLFGNATSVLAGDYLLTEAFDLLRPFHRSLSDQAILVVREMTKAAILEINYRGDTDLSVHAWRAIARGKTGVLFSWCGFAAGHCCNNQEASLRLWEVGERIGIIFQLADDLKDFDGDQNLKDVCRDIRNQEPSLPIILAIESDSSIKQRFSEAFAGSAIDEQVVSDLRDMVVNSGAIAKTRALMLRELDQVMTALSVYEGTKGKACLDRFASELASVGI